MKKIDDEFIEKVIDAVGISHVAWDCVEPRELCEVIIEIYEGLEMKESVLIPKDEYDYLKRIERNIKAEIAAIRDSIEQLDNAVAIKSAQKEIEFLESLDK